jgi:hypothetical protein
MTSVNGVVDEEHLPRLVGSLFVQVRTVFAAEFRATLAELARG